MKKIELLSPAGGINALHAAVQNGADAVYLGEKSFSARQGAENFDFDALKSAVRYSHERGTKVYLALNTLIHEKEQQAFEKSVSLAADCGVDGLIIQDFGGAYIAKKVCPEMPIHASTQMSAHNEKDVLFLLERGFSRVVLARELSKEEIYKIYKNTKASLEVFVHGALCVCVSGQCLMSSFIGGRSGNRGACAQPCRQQYTALGKKGYFLSPRDLCLLDEIESLYETGVESLKIEGRMKSAEYVATVTAMYRKYLDNPKRADSEDIKALEKVFVRGDGFTKAYYASVNTPEMMNYDLSNDGISYKSDKELLKKAQQSYREGVENKKIPVDGYFTLKADSPMELVLTDGRETVSVYGSKGEIAINTPLTEDAARERIGKMGQTPFVLNRFDAVIDTCLTVSAKDINALRRSAAEELLNLRGRVHKREVYPFEYKYPKNKKGSIKISASVLTKEQLAGCGDVDIIYMPLHVYEQSEKTDKYVVQLPKVNYNIDNVIKRLKNCGAKKVLASTYGTIKALIEEGFTVYGDYGLNIANPVSANEYKKCGIDRITVSPELKIDEIRSITSNTDAECEVLGYGRMMMMTTRACIIKGVKGKCDCDKPLTLYDKTGSGFMVYSDKEEHINMIYNTSVTFMADKMEVFDFIGADIIRLVFTDEDKSKCEEIVSMYKGDSEAVLPKSFTRGYFAKNKERQRGR